MDDYKRQIKEDWSPKAGYYEIAEASLCVFWAGAPRHPALPRWPWAGWRRQQRIFTRMFKTLDRGHLVELACGHGRHAVHIRDHYGFGHFTLVDINQANIEICEQRFAGDDRFSYLVNSGSDLSAMATNSCTAVFCYDAMVHFEYDDVLSYLREIYRVLCSEGTALLHHSNYDQNPGARYSDNPHWRNFMSSALVAHAAIRIGFTVVEQQILAWGRSARLDCATLLAKPGSPPGPFLRNR